VKLRFAATRLLALFRKRRLDGELEGEILAHLEMAELDAIAGSVVRAGARLGVPTPALAELLEEASCRAS